MARGGGGILATIVKEGKRRVEEEEMAMARSVGGGGVHFGASIVPYEIVGVGGGDYLFTEKINAVRREEETYSAINSNDRGPRRRMRSTSG